MSTRRLLDLLRLLSLAGALAAIGVAWFWERIRVHIDPYDERMVSELLEGPQASFESAVAALRAGDRAAGIESLAALATELEDVRLGARLETLKTSTLDLLTAELVAAERLDEAVRYSDELLDFNPRDFPARLRRAEIHRRLGNDAEELADLTAAYAVGAASGAATAPFVDAMARRGDREAVATALLELGNSGPLVLPVDGWEFRTAPGPDFAFAPPDSVQFTQEQASRYTWRLDLSEAPRTIRSVRIDLPSASQILVRSASVQMVSRTGEARELGVSDLVVANHMTKEPSGALLSAGELDPYLILMSSDGADSGALQNAKVIEVTLEMAPALSSAARDLFAGGVDAEERARWTGTFGEEAVKTLEASLGR
ncbi:MAG: hypothetical protein AAGG01_04335 [Planctomycetota bacterium]